MKLRSILGFFFCVCIMVLNRAYAQDYKYSDVLLDESFANENVEHVHKDSKGVYWIAKGDELWTYDEHTFHDFGAENGLQLAKITAIKETQEGNVCIATAGKGLIIIQEGNIIEVTTGNGLSSDICNNLFIDEKDYLWVALDKGIAKIKVHGANELEIHLGSSFEDLADIQIYDINKEGDVLWLMTSEGLIALNEEKSKLNSAPPGISISGIRINGRDTIVKSSFILDHDIRDVKIGFTIENPEEMGNVTYKYKMLGIDTSWIYTEISSVQYSYLTPNRYTFLVSGINEDGISSKEPASIEFIISRPFYESWWFKAVIINILGIGLLLFYFLRIRQIKRRADEQTKLHKKISQIELKALRAQMNPHFIFNSLNSIQHFITKNDQESAHKYLSKFAKLMRMILESSKKFTTSIEDETKALEFYLELEALRFENRFDYKINIDKSIDISNTEIPTMIIQPYIENAIWHGLMNKESKGTISLTIKDKDNAIQCIIEDDGIGRKMAKELRKERKTEYKSVGMLVTKERLEILNDIYDNKTYVKIKDLVDENNKSMGTKVIIMIPAS